MPDLERIQQLTPGTLSQQWYEDGAAVDPGTVTLGVTRADGTVLVAAGTATAGATTAPRTFNLTTTHTSLLDRLTVTWTSTLKGTLVSYVEVVGGYLFSIAEARANPSLTSTVNFPTASIIAMRTTVEDALEHACSRAFVPRYTKETFSGTGTTTVVLSRPDIRAIRTVTVAGVAYTAGELAGLAFSPTGELYTPLRWTCGASNVTVGYEHGMSFVPPEVTRAALTLAKMWLVGQRNPIDDRAITFNTTDGGTYSLAVPGRNGSVFGQPDVDSVISRYDLSVGIA